MAAAVVVVALVIVGAIRGNDSPLRHDAATPAATHNTNPPSITPTEPPSSLAPATALAPATSSSPTTLPQASAPGGLVPLTIATPHPEGYNRDLFGSGWIDSDHDCQDSRAEVLVAQSLTPVSFITAADCTVATGTWIDPWSGTQNSSARALDIDHTVPLANAWRSGASAWTTARRLAYANDVTDRDHLLAIPLGENRSKGDDGPEAWKPPDPKTWCRYAQSWDSIKARWNLTATPAEWAALISMAATC